MHACEIGKKAILVHAHGADAGVHMRMQINQPWRHDLAGDIHDAIGLSRVEMWRNLDDLPPRDCDVEAAFETLAWIKYLPTLYEYVNHDVLLYARQVRPPMAQLVLSPRLKSPRRSALGTPLDTARCEISHTEHSMFLNLRRRFRHRRCGCPWALSSE